MLGTDTSTDASLPLQSPEPRFLSNTVLQSCHHYGVLHEVSQTATNTDEILRTLKLLISVIF